jgi:hypothetical protein
MHGLYVAIFVCGTMTLTVIGLTLTSLAEQRTKQLELLAAMNRADRPSP